MPFNCDKHGYILYGATRLNCERDREQITPQTPKFSPLFAVNTRLRDKLDEQGLRRLFGAAPFGAGNQDEQAVTEDGWQLLGAALRDMDGPKFNPWQLAFSPARPKLTINSIAALKVET